MLFFACFCFYLTTNKFFIFKEPKANHCFKLRPLNLILKRFSKFNSFMTLNYLYGIFPGVVQASFYIH